MKERPIIFSGEMVLAILEGRKTQTRRVGKRDWPSNPLIWGDEPYKADDGKFYVDETTGLGGSELVGHEVQCPYGVPGDRLYIKEVHYLWGEWARFNDGWRFIRDELWPCMFDISGEIDIGRKLNLGMSEETGWYKRSPLFMEKRDARKWLEVVNVKVERLQDVSIKDCYAEGVRHPNFPYNSVGSNFGIKLIFEDLWSSIHGPDAWEQNPWVWVIEFKEVK